jgi:AcrR family transcriptional regulator
MSSRKDQKAATRQRLVEVAAQVFAREGIAATTTATVAAAAEVSHGTVFAHFPTRDDLVLAVVDDCGTRLGREIDARLEAAGDVRAVLTAHLAALATFEDFYARLVAELPGLPEKVRGLVFLIHAAVSYRLELVARPEAHAGLIKPLSRADLFNTWVSLVHYHLINRRLFVDQGSYLEARGKQLVDLYMTLVTT